MGKNGKAKKARARSLSRESSHSESDFSSDWDSESPRERRRTTSGEQIRVVVIGGGVSGMSAARGLMNSEELDCTVQLLEARDRAGGRVCTWTFEEQSDWSAPAVQVDLGANYITGDTEGHGPVWQKAKQDGLLCSLAPGRHWDSTQMARWFDPVSKSSICPTDVLRIHILASKVQGRLARMGLTAKATETVADAIPVALDYVLTRMDLPPLDETAAACLHVVLQKAMGYVSSLSELALKDLAMEEADPEEDDDEYGSETWMQENVESYAHELDTFEPPLINPASDAEGPGCRLVVNGYKNFLVDPLAAGLDLKKNKVVRAVDATPDGVTVTCSDGSSFEGEYVVVSVPLGVLKGRSDQSSIQFTPPLPERKQQAIERIGMGAHNKVVLRFTEAFWPENTPYLNCPDSRFQWLNLHAFGKTGVLLTHVWPPHAYGWGGRSDEEILEDVLSVLSKMFDVSELPDLIDYKITHWDTDPFSMGSYSFMGVGSTKEDTEELRKPCGHGRIFFCGEATSKNASQCVHGAFISGQDAVREVEARALACETTVNTFTQSANLFDMLDEEDIEREAVYAQYSVEFGTKSRTSRLIEMINEQEPGEEGETDTASRVETFNGSISLKEKSPKGKKGKRRKNQKKCSEIGTPKLTSLEEEATIVNELEGFDIGD